MADARRISANESANNPSNSSLLVAGFNSWEDPLAEGSRKAGKRRTRDSAVPRDLAIGLFCAIEGGLLLAKTSRAKDAEGCSRFGVPH